MRRAVVVLGALAVLLSCQPAHADTGRCVTTAAPSRQAAVEINKRAFEVFRKVSLEKHPAIALSPLLRWYAERMWYSKRGASVCAAFDTNASLNAQFSADLPKALALPYYVGHGVSGIRLDSTEASVDLYLFYAMPGQTVPLIRNFQQSLNEKTWEEITSAFQPRTVSVLPFPLLASGSSVFTVDALRIDEHVNLDLERTTLHVSGTVSATTSRSPGDSITGRLSPAEQLVWILVDEKTGAIVLIGANVAETEPD